MLDQIKKKRLNLTHSFDTNRPRINSSEKRKEIEANLQKFKKDVRESRPRSPLRSELSFQQNKLNENLKASPTMKDLINPFVNIQQQKITQQIQSPRFKTSDDSKHEQKLPKDVMQDIQSAIKNTKENNQIQQSPKKYPFLQTPIGQSEKLQRQMSFGGEQLKFEMQKVNSPKAVQQVYDRFQPSYERNDEKNQLNFNYNQSNYGSSNGSSAIFFTSQFREYINKQKAEQIMVSPVAEIQPITQSHKKSEPSQHHSQNHTQTDKEIGDSFLKMGEEEISQLNDSRSKKMTHNQSGRSLAFSNNDESTLRESKANQYVHELVNKKLDEELVLEISHFGRNKFKEFIQKYDRVRSINSLTGIKQQLKLLRNLMEVQKKVELNLMRYCFDGFLILKEWRFLQMKNQIKADSFRKEANQKLIKNIFEAWRILGLENEKKIIVSNKKKEEKLKRNIYQVFKMIWFDSKVKRQVDLYYLSKIFSAFKNAVASSRKKSDNQALKQYCRSLKRRYFQKIQEGTEVLKRERLNEELAESHFRSSTLKRYFDAWAEQCSRSPQYVSLTMTYKNVFKQTADNKWLGIRTVDFKQLQ